MAQKQSTNEITLRYAQALYALSEQQQQTQQVDAELTDLCALIAEHDNLQKAFSNPILSYQQKLKLCQALSEKLALSDIVRKFICLLAVKSRLSLLELIQQKYKEFWANSRGETKIEVTSAHMLDDEILSFLKKQLEQMMGKSVFIDNRVDNKIIAGLIVKMGSYMFDFSAQNRLRRIATFMEGL